MVSLISQQNVTINVMLLFWITYSCFILWIKWLKLFNSLWPSDAMWRQRSGSTLAHVMACCLTAPSHYLKQYWPIIISHVLWHSPQGNFTRNAQDIYIIIRHALTSFEKCYFYITPAFLSANAFVYISRPRRNCRHFEDISKCIYLNENESISLKISLKFLPNVWINNIQALVQTVSLLTHICVTRPQWLN